MQPTSTPRVGAPHLLSIIFAAACVLLVGVTTTPVAAEETSSATGATDSTEAESSGFVQRDPQPTLTGTDLVDDEFLSSWPMFGSNMRMKIGGYVKADFVVDLDGTTDRTQFLMSTIPVPGEPAYGNSGYVQFFSRESRFNVDVRRIEKDAVPLRMFIEGDFWSTGNQFRLRHAYIVAGDVIIGQTWTTLSFLESLPFMIDFAAGDALFGGRTTQLRYQKKVNDGLKLAAALENLDFVGIENPSGLPGAASPRFPLLAVRADCNWDHGLLLLGASVAELRWDGGELGPDAEALQIDGVVGGRQYIGKSSFVTWNVSYGKGSGENIMAFEGTSANAVLNPDGTLETMPAFAFVAGLGTKWNEKCSSNFSYAYGWLDPPATRDPLALKRGGVAHVNFIVQPVKHFSYGAEYMHGVRRTTDNSRGTANRFQLMAKFDF